MKNRKFYMFLFSALMAVLFVACGGQEVAQPEAVEEAVSEPVEEVVVEEEVEEAVVEEEAPQVVAQSSDAGGAGEREICAIGGADAFFAVVKNGADAAGARQLKQLEATTPGFHCLTMTTSVLTW